MFMFLKYVLPGILLIGTAGQPLHIILNTAQLSCTLDNYKSVFDVDRLNNMIVCSNLGFIVAFVRCD